MEVVSLEKDKSDLTFEVPSNLSGAIECEIPEKNHHRSAYFNLCMTLVDDVLFRFAGEDGDDGTVACGMSEEEEENSMKNLHQKLMTYWLNNRCNLNKTHRKILFCIISKLFFITLANEYEIMDVKPRDLLKSLMKQQIITEERIPVEEYSMKMFEVAVETLVENIRFVLFDDNLVTYVKLLNVCFAKLTIVASKSPGTGILNKTIYTKKKSNLYVIKKRFIQDMEAIFYGLYIRIHIVNHTICFNNVSDSIIPTSSNIDAVGGDSGSKAEEDVENEGENNGFLSMISDLKVGLKVSNVKEEESEEEDEDNDSGSSGDEFEEMTLKTTSEAADGTNEGEGEEEHTKRDNNVEILRSINLDRDMSMKNETDTTVIVTFNDSKERKVLTEIVTWFNKNMKIGLIEIAQREMKDKMTEEYIAPGEVEKYLKVQGVEDCEMYAVACEYRSESIDNMWNILDRNTNKTTFVDNIYSDVTMCPYLDIGSTRVKVETEILSHMMLQYYFDKHMSGQKVEDYIWMINESFLHKYVHRDADGLADIVKKIKETDHPYIMRVFREYIVVSSSKVVICPNFFYAFLVWVYILRNDPKFMGYMPKGEKNRHSVHSIYDECIKNSSLSFRQIMDELDYDAHGIDSKENEGGDKNDEKSEAEENADLFGFTFPSCVEEVGFNKMAEGIKSRFRYNGIATM